MGTDAADIANFLAKGDFTPGELKAKVEGIDFLRPWEPGDPFPIGIVRPDGFRVRISTSPDKLTDLAGQLGSTDFPIRSWRVFPVGIVAPERLEIDLEMGSRLGG